MPEQINTVVSLNSDIVRPDDGNTEQRAPLNASSATNKASDGTCSTSRSLSTDEAFKQLDGQLGEATGICASDAMDLGLPSLAASSLPDNVDLVQGRIDRIQLDLDTLYDEVGSVAKSLLGEKSDETRAKVVARMRHLSQSIRRMIAVRDSLLSCMAALPVVSSSVDGVKPGRSPSYEPVIDPNDLPAFQWVGMDVFDPKSMVFPTIDCCLLRFQDIMFAYGLDFDEEYARIVPLLLCREQRDWYESFKSSYSPSSPASWNDFKYALKARYEASALIGRQDCACELINIRIMPHEKVEAFMDRFLGLRRQAADQAPQDFLLVQPFLNALPWDVKWRVDVREIQGTTNNPNIDAIAFITREVLKITSGSELAVAGHVYKTRYIKEATKKKACTFHKRKRHNHDTSECNKRLRKVKRQRQKKRAARSANTPATNNNPSDQHHSTYLTYYL